jgi:hypothetical protein
MTAVRTFSGRLSRLVEGGESPVAVASSMRDVWRSPSIVRSSETWMTAQARKAKLNMVIADICMVFLVRIAITVRSNCHRLDVSAEARERSVFGRAYWARPKMIKKIGSRLLFSCIRAVEFADLTSALNRHSMFACVVSRKSISRDSRGSSPR